MRLEARPIEFTDGHAHFYCKKKVDSVELLLSQCCHLMDKLISVSWVYICTEKNLVHTMLKFSVNVKTGVHFRHKGSGNVHIFKSEQQ